MKKAVYAVAVAVLVLVAAVLYAVFYEPQGASKETVKWWDLQSGVNARDENGDTPLHWAAGLGKTEAIRELLKAGADIEARDNDGRTALMPAASWSWGFEELLKALPGSEPGSSVWGDEAIRELLKAGAEVNARADNGYTALMWAAVKGGKRAIRELLKAGADIEARNNEGRTVLMEAAHGGNTKAIIELLKAGADIEARDNEGKTAFDVWQWEGGEWETEGYQIISDLLRP